MSAILVIAWMATGILTVPLIVGYMNRRGDSMLRDPAFEAFAGAAFGPIPAAMFCGYYVLRTLGRIAYKITRQDGEPS